MIVPAHQKCIQIVCTNVCQMNCCHCSQMCPHVPKDREYFMSLEQVERALDSLKDYPGHIGLFGGEPTLHPQFEEICKLYQKHVPVKARRELWTNGAKWKKYEKLINETFYRELIAYNEHEERQPCWHQPTSIALKEVVDSPIDRSKLKGNCWVQLRWSSAITPMGAYFCEVASAREYTLSRWNGLKVESGWWKKPETCFMYQYQSCDDCSMCIPMPDRFMDQDKIDLMSSSTHELFRKAGSPKVEKRVNLNTVRYSTAVANIKDIRKFLTGHEFEPETEYEKRGWFKDFPEWRPNVYRPLSEKKHAPEDVCHC